MRPLSSLFLSSLLVLGLALPAQAMAQGLSLIDESEQDSQSHSDGEAWLPLSSLRSEPGVELTRSIVKKSAPTISWKNEAHALVFKHQKAWVLPTLVHGFTPGLILLGGIADQAQRNPDCFSCGSEVSYAASLAFYFHASSVIAGGVTWLTFGDLHNRIYFEDDKARLVDRLEQTGRGFGVAAIVSGTLAALSAGILFAAITSEEPWNNPIVDMQGLFIMGWIQNGLAAPIFAHIAIANAVIAEQIDAIGEDGGSPGDATAMLRRSRRPRLLGASPFGFSMAF
jgi:hypothetical protein